MKTILRRSKLSRSSARGSLAMLTPILSRSMATSSVSTAEPFRPTDEFAHRHMGPRDSELGEMLKTIDPSFKTLDDLINKTIPNSIRLNKPVDLPAALTETQALVALEALADKNTVLKSMIGMGYYGTVTPGVILRNVLESPVWYTSYTPYQAEISQGRLESLLNYQTMVKDLTGMDISNASLLDESTAAAESMFMAFGQHNQKRKKFIVSPDVHPQTIDVVKTRAKHLGIELVFARPSEAVFDDNTCGVLAQYPSTYGEVSPAEIRSLAERAHAAKASLVTASDLLACVAIESPGSLGADIVVGSAQRFGVPMGFGGPHAGFLACREVHMRRMPGRVIGVSVDAQGNRALRMALQTREQHIRRDKATSNICTAQALLANMAAFYAVYHGPEGLRAIAGRVHAMAVALSRAINQMGLKVNAEFEGSSATPSSYFFDTFTVRVKNADLTIAEAAKKGVNLRKVNDFTIGISVDETTQQADLESVLAALGWTAPFPDWKALSADTAFPSGVARSSALLEHPVFNTHRSETQLLRYIHRLQNKDLSLTHSMISLGSCTMKLNATSEMIPITWPKLANLHPFAPAEQTAGSVAMINELAANLAKITGFAAVSVQPNSGAAGEYAGLLAIKQYLASKGESHRNVCLIPISAHGTNPASAVVAGLKVVVVNSDSRGNVDIEDLRKKAEQYKDTLAALMITYPSTYGVFEEGVKEIIETVHSRGGQVYMDGANMNAQVGLTSPGHIGADVCHLNLHKTFCIPHGGGGPGVGAIGVAKHLAPFLPGHAVVPTGGTDAAGDALRPRPSDSVAGAPFGSALILPISHMYIRMLGETGLKQATQTAILNANYLMARLANHYPVLYTNGNGRCAHEFILDIRPLKAASGGAIDEQDIAKRLIDYGFHAPTMSWPVPGTLMIEPTESEDKAELDRFADALISIRGEIDEIIAGGDKLKENNVLVNAPHTAAVLVGEWNRPYPRDQAVYPKAWVRANKFWPSVGRVDNAYGDRNLQCSCEPVENYM